MSGPPSAPGGACSATAATVALGAVSAVRGIGLSAVTRPAR
ncbi:hypothetical protein FHX34_103827 [Actinoplanes teichomyceticus]|uniref:Uncharacterized protein n=1 Tax=Actinoplanes teichomyceticus TaxID=1867 RepID=A0A561WBQ9_ACTTI|nr:hypothetical protein FHX34_103827 [Actinoplanes teichomyceticus]